MAGASAAAALAERRRVLLLEREAQPGYHTTGRSAALLTPFYGNAVVRRLNLAGAAFYRDPPPGFADAPLITPRGVLYVARQDQLDLVRAEAEAVRPLCPEARLLDADEARALVPPLRRDYVGGALLDPTAADMDVAAILQAFLRRLRAPAIPRGVPPPPGRRPPWTWPPSFKPPCAACAPSAARSAPARSCWASSAAATSGTSTRATARSPRRSSSTRPAPGPTS